MHNQNEEVIQFLKKLNHPLKKEVEEVRKIILDSNTKITEHIKWNAPSFCYNGEDRITFNLHAKDKIQLIFHRGAKVKDDKDLKFEDNTGLIEWLGKDRATVKLKDLKDVEAKKASLEKLINKWIKI